jgi:subtilase family serine protease
MKNRLLCAGVAAGILTAACSGNAMSPMPPGASTSGLGGTARLLNPVEHVPPGWAATATRAIPVKSFPTASVPATMPMHIVVGLYMRDRDGAQKLLHSQHTRGASEFMQWLTPQQFTARFNPTASQAASVADYLRREGFRNVTIEPNRLIVSGTATAARVEAAFNTSIHGSVVNGTEIYGNVKPALVPVKLRKIVAAVLGLSNAYQMRVHIKKSDRMPMMTATGTQQLSPLASPTEPPCTTVTVTNVCEFGFYGPIQYQIAYDAPQCKDAVRGSHIGPAWANCSGEKTSIAVISDMAYAHASEVQTDLRAAETYWGLPAVPFSVRKVGVSGNDTSGLDEWDLDTQISSGFAELVKHLYLYTTTSLTDSDIALAYSHWVTDDLAQAGNSSFGEPETLAYADGSMLLDDEEFNQAASQGQTMFASTGDNGTGCPVILASGAPNTGVPEVCYPATSPYVVGVGGTTLDTNAVGASGPCTDCGYPGTYYGEHAWVATGGGYSTVETAPYWQANGICAVCSTPDAPRGIADIAMCADNNGCPMWVDVGGTWEGVGGTSLSSPMSMGAWSRLETHFNNTLGFAAPVYYGVYGYYEPCPLGSTACLPACEPTCDTAAAPPDTTAPVGGFHDILIGTNGIPSSAGPGWDEPTGLGSIDYAVMQADITNSIFSGH